ncbi:MAG: hypothetical protein AAGA12_11285 [Pseudomonadota bacterium]
MKTVLILGSGPKAQYASAWPKSRFSHWMAINNAWSIRPDWDETIHPEDFAEERRPTDVSLAQSVTSADRYVDALNTFGGVVYCGATMAFTAGYWALASQRPDVVAFFGCDMVYPSEGNTHFYGQGAADPLRDDITLQSLDAKSARMMIHAAAQGCALVNLSTDESRLILPRAAGSDIETFRPMNFDADLVARAHAREAELGYQAPTGRYWETLSDYDPDALLALDHLWLEAGRSGY